VDLPAELTIGKAFQDGISVEYTVVILDQLGK
jgi:hypothetical protein